MKCNPSNDVTRFSVWGPLIVQLTYALVYGYMATNNGCMQYSHTPLPLEKSRILEFFFKLDYQLPYQFTIIKIGLELSFWKYVFFASVWLQLKHKYRRVYFEMRVYFCNDAALNIPTFYPIHTLGTVQTLSFQPIHAHRSNIFCPRDWRLST